MVDFNMDDLEIDMSHDIKCVASVSYDRQKNEFKFSDGCQQEFGDNLAGMVQRQGKTVTRAQQKFNRNSNGGQKRSTASKAKARNTLKRISSEFEQTMLDRLCANELVGNKQIKQIGLRLADEFKRGNPAKHYQIKRRLQADVDNIYEC